MRCYICDHDGPLAIKGVFKEDHIETAVFDNTDFGRASHKDSDYLWYGSSIESGIVGGSSPAPSVDYSSKNYVHEIDTNGKKEYICRHCLDKCKDYGILDSQWQTVEDDPIMDQRFLSDYHEDIDQEDDYGPRLSDE